MRGVYFLIAVVIGLLIMKYTEPIVRIVGKSDLAEKYLGQGGSFLMWKLLAVAAMVITLIYWVGWRL